MNKNISDIIKHTFVINLKNRTDRWDKIQNDFKNTKLELIRYPAVHGKELKAEEIKKMTTPFCNNFCSSGMIGCWLSHYNLWKYIVKHNLDNVLILEDDAEPVKNFNEKLIKYWKDVPENWDIVYIGCFGSCDSNINDLFKLVGKGNKKLKNIIVPSIPLGMHAYMISNKGARKLIEENYMKKIKHHIDTTLSYYYNFYDKDNPVYIYAFEESIINQSGNIKGSDLIKNNHPILNYVISKIPISKDMTLDFPMNTQIFNYRKYDIIFDGYIILFAIISFLIGLFGNNDTLIGYLIIINLLNFVDTTISENKIKSKISNFTFETTIIIIFLFLGIIIRRIVKRLE